MFHAYALVRNQLMQFFAFGLSLDGEQDQLDPAPMVK